MWFDTFSLVGELIKRALKYEKGLITKVFSPYISSDV